ncbi:MAG: hypothetical protein Q9166_007101 [cf. Caloplaca sp. 2 TL-2023]
MAALVSSNKKTILKGVHEQQFPEYYQFFGMVGEETLDQDYHVAIETRTPRMGFGTRAVGRIVLFAALAEDIEKAATTVHEEGITITAGSEELTRKALMLFWKMQWNYRPGLDHLCDQDETERNYLNIRHKLFTAATPAVQARFKEILKLVGSRLWKDLELWDFTIDWSARNQRYIIAEHYITARDLETWVQDLPAELTIEVISKIGIVRAIKLDHADSCGWDMSWLMRDW